MSNEPLPLFRTEALDSVRPKAYGRIIFIRPLSFTVLTGAAVLIVATIVGFFIWGRYTQHTTLAGQLVPTAGVIGVHTPLAGTIVEKLVSEGDEVEAGQVLYTVSGEVYSEDRGAVQEVIGAQLTLQEQSLLRQIEQTRFLESQERDALRRDIESLKTERATLAAMLENNRARLALSAQTLERYRKTADRGAVSREQLANAQTQHLDAQARLQSMEREDTGFERRITEAQTKLATLRARYAAQISDLERAVSTSRRGIAENDARRIISVRAPASGITTAVVGEAGQMVDTSRPLLTIVPRDAVLEAQLLAPTHTVGFIRPGSAVMLRYDAFPYQRFGHHQGELRSVSRAVVASAEATSADSNGAAQPLYLVKVALQSQAVSAYGEPRRLQAGMTVQADVLQDTRRLYEWVLEPLYSIAGKLHKAE